MKHIIYIILLLFANVVNAQCVHPEIGTKAISKDSMVTIELIAKKQRYSSDEKDTWDSLINSPKSVNIHPNGIKYYINSLEGATTICYNFNTQTKINEIHHNFDEIKDSKLWNEPSGLFTWKHYHEHQKTFYGKPVESTFSHGGRYLWIPYYRRSFDINAQDPSAVAVIDTYYDKIIRLFETGPLPKMIAVSPDGNQIAISHWGDNTVGLIDITSANPNDWKYKSVLTVDYQLKLDFPLDRTIDRDNGSGYALRGTVFTPDNKYLLVGCMGGGGGIAVIDINSYKYLGRILGMNDNVRHLLLSNGYIYLSINRAGLVQRAKLSSFISVISTIKNKVGYYNSWETCKVGQGARTISCSPNGRYLFVACNNVSSIYIIDTRSFSVICNIPADSYPVGLDVSNDGKYILTTSQGRNDKGGNAVDIYKVEYEETQEDRYCLNCGTQICDSISICSMCHLIIKRNIQNNDSVYSNALVGTTAMTTGSFMLESNYINNYVLLIICIAILIIIVQTVHNLYKRKKILKK